ncbi:Obscurin-like protein 1 [Labeo rohita]|uniref:Obscurin-like protein 1 n=1 Tax=Labeo rohita TaxID=84645 RepID=A0ABQ8MSX7_LABRO|nr:Obscurin-like protein 1 [Labeo rohita]
MDLNLRVLDGGVSGQLTEKIDRLCSFTFIRAHCNSSSMHSRASIVGSGYNGKGRGTVKLNQMSVFGESVSVMEGDSVTLHTDVTEIHEDEDILWIFGAEKSQIAKMKKKKQIFNTSDVSDGRFRDRLKLDNQTGSLTITDITTQHAGLYQLEIVGAKRSSKTFSVFVNMVNVSDVSLSWYKENILLSSISVSDLSISLSLPLEVEYQDKNTYSCVINNPISNQTTHLDIKLCQTCAVPPVSVSAAVSVSLLIVTAVVIFWTCRKYRKTDQEGKC